MPPLRQPAAASPSAEQHGRIADIDAAIIALVRRRLEAMAELEELRRQGRAPRVELSHENAVFRRYETELGRLGTGLATLLVREAAARPGRVRAADPEPADPGPAGPEPAGVRAADVRAAGVRAADPGPAEVRPAGVRPAQAGTAAEGEVRPGARTGSG